METAIQKSPTLFAFGVNHKTASIEVREKVYLREDEIAEFSNLLRETLDECIIISTCNRTEIYGLYDSAQIDFEFYQNLLINFKNASDFVAAKDFFSFVSCAACQQLFSVTTSIDSKIVGDTQILQQVRRAYEKAHSLGSAGKITHQLFQRALKIGKKAYSETTLHRGAISVSLAAVELARQTFDSLAQKTVLIIGAGETAQLAAECLLKNRIGKILVCNRTRSHAEEFLNKLHEIHRFESEAIDFEDLQARLAEADIVISSTSSPEYILRREDFGRLSRKILLIDIALPRDIEPEAAENKYVVLKNIDDLNLVVDRNFERRMAQLPQVKKIIYREMGDFLVWYYSQPFLPDFQRSAAKTDREKVEKIKSIREFLIENASTFHRMAGEKNVRQELDAHLNLVNQLHQFTSSRTGAASLEK